MKNKLNINILIWFYTIYIFYALDIYLRWIIDNDILYITFVLVNFIIVINYSSMYFNKNSNVYSTLLLIVFIAYITLPLFEGYTLRLGHILYFIPLIYLFFLSNSILLEIFKKFEKLLYFFIISGLVIYILVLLGINIPHFNIEREGTRQHWRVYYLAVSLYEGNFASMTYSIERFCGPFAEPGNAAIYLALILILNNLDFATKKNKVYLIAGVLTLSPVFYFILLNGYLIKLYNERTISKNVIFSATFLLLILLFSLTDTKAGRLISNFVYERNFENTRTNPIDNRIPIEFLKIYDRFSESGKLFVGNGYESLQNLPSTPNYRTFIYRFGIIGLTLSLFIIISMMKSLNKINLLLWILILFSIVSHRYWFFLIPGVYAFFKVGLVHFNTNLIRNKPVVSLLKSRNY